MNIGDYIQGGIYVGDDLIIAHSDYQKRFKYGGITDEIIIATSPNDGYTNTKELVFSAYGCSEDSMPEAALYCDSLIIDGYDNWYLPSKNELLNIMKKVGETDLIRGLCYWASTRFTNFYAVAVFNRGNHTNNWPKNELNVLPTRKLQNFN